MGKIIAIARRYVYTTFTDVSLLIIMILTPLTISTIIALAFRDVSSGNAPLRNIPVAVVNLDQGVTVQGNTINHGDFLMNILIPPTNEANTSSTTDNEICAPLIITTNTSNQPQANIAKLISATRLADPTLARAGVEDGSYAAAIIIPENFSQNITYTGPNFTFTPVQIEVYGDANRSISAGVVRSIVESVNNSILAGNITFATFYDTLIAQRWNDLLLLSQTGVFNAPLACAFNPSIANLRVDLQSIEGEAPPPFNALAILGSAMASFFALFTASGAATNILEERRNGTLQRMFISPTPRFTVLLGLLTGTLMVVLVQLVLLFVALNIINAILQGQFSFIWGTNWLAIIGLVLATALSVSGVGILIAALSKTAEQSSIYGSLVSMFMGVVGGAFFDVSLLPDILTRFSVVRWSTEGFTRLSQGNSDILLNVGWLLIIGAVLFTLGMVIFTRRQDV